MANLHTLFSQSNHLFFEVYLMNTLHRQFQVRAYPGNALVKIRLILVTFYNLRASTELHCSWLLLNYSNSSSLFNTSLVPRPERERRKRTWLPLFVHVLNCGGIPPAPQTINLHLYTCDVETDNRCYVVHTLTHVS